MNMEDERYAGPERRSGTPLSTALTSIIELQGEVEHLARAVTVNKETQTQANRKIGMLGVVSIMMIGLFLITWQAGNNAKNAVHTLQDCLVVGGKCFTDLASRGQQGTVRSVKFQSCVLNTLPSERTAEKTVRCAKLVYPDIPNLDQQIREVIG
jgi:hypothetical protein